MSKLLSSRVCNSSNVEPILACLHCKCVFFICSFICVFWFWRKNKIRVTFQGYSCHLFPPPCKHASGLFSATIMQINGFTSINLQVYELLVTIEIYLHSQQKLMSSVQLIEVLNSPLLTIKYILIYSEASLTFFLASVFEFNMAVTATCTFVILLTIAYVNYGKISYFWDTEGR